MKLISWNASGFRACLKKDFRPFFENVNADIICLQEIKVTKEQYDFSPKGYYEYLFPAIRKGCSGTLIYTKIKPLNVKYRIRDIEYDNEGRKITLNLIISI